MSQGPMPTNHDGVASSPLLSPRELDAPLAWRDGQALSGQRYLADVAALAKALPAQGQPVNLCVDRYHFAVALGAALMRGQASLLPPNALPETLRHLDRAQGAPYALVDTLADAASAGVEGGPDGLVRLPVAPHLGLPATGKVEGDAAGDVSMVPPSIADQQAAACLLTSGSTGVPQPHAKQWHTLVRNIAAEAERLAEHLGRPTLAGLNVVATVPPQHSYGFESSVLLGLLGGAAFDTGRPFYPADIAAALARLPEPRALVTTPFHLKTLLLAGVELPVVDLIVSATAPLSPQLAAQAERATGAQLLEIYGCTEAGQVATRRTTEGETWTTFGALRLHFETVDGDERYLVQGGHVAEPTPLADVLQLVDDRRFRLLGRANDLIHVAGKRSSLAHLNFQLQRLDGVDDGAFWLPDETADEVVRPVAFVVAPGLSSREIAARLRETLDAVFVPRRIVHVPSLPRDATGKLGAQVLRRFALAQLNSHATGEPRADGDTSR